MHLTPHHQPNIHLWAPFLHGSPWEGGCCFWSLPAHAFGCPYSFAASDVKHGLDPKIKSVFTCILNKKIKNTNKKTDWITEVIKMVFCFSKLTNLVWITTFPSAVALFKRTFSDKMRIHSLPLQKRSTCSSVSCRIGLSLRGKMSMWPWNEKQLKCRTNTDHYRLLGADYRWSSHHALHSYWVFSMRNRECHWDMDTDMWGERERQKLERYWKKRRHSEMLREKATRDKPKCVCVLDDWRHLGCMSFHRVWALLEFTTLLHFLMLWCSRVVKENIVRDTDGKRHVIFNEWDKQQVKKALKNLHFYLCRYHISPIFASVYNKLQSCVYCI